MDLQTIAAFAFVLAAVVYLIRRYRRSRRAPSGCPGCNAACRRDTHCDR